MFDIALICFGFFQDLGTKDRLREKVFLVFQIVRIGKRFNIANLHFYGSTNPLAQCSDYGLQ